MNETPSQTVGPFFDIGLAWMTTLVPEHLHSNIEIVGTVHDGVGAVPDAVLELCHPTGFARALTGPDGSYTAILARPLATGDNRPLGIDVSVFARGLLRHLVTRMYLPWASAGNDLDPVLASVPANRRDTLMASLTEEHQVRFDLYLQGPRETVFLAY